MKSSLRTKLAISYGFVAIISILFISVMINIFLENQFKVYTIRSQQYKNDDLVNLISKQYSENGEWNNKAIENVGVNAIEQGLIIKVTAVSGKIVWDASIHNNGLCKQMIDHMEKNMTQYYGSDYGKYEVKMYPIFYKQKKVGTVQIGSYGPFFYNDNDINYINTLNKLVLAVGILTFILALILGGIMAKRISTPISRVVKAAGSIEKGCFDNRIIEKSDTKEIDLLIVTINNLAQTLERQEKLRIRMSADVAHELRTPLATLQSHMEAMIDEIWKPTCERLTSCHEEILRIGRLVGDLTSLAKYESEEHNIYKVKYDLCDQINNTIFNFEAEFKNKNLEVIFNNVSDIKVMADKDKISQVLINIISNALKYTDKNGFVKITAKNSDDYIVIKIEDSGKGISKEDLPFVFERFYRADKSRNRLTGGSGIGLTITKAIVDAHNGKIEVESTLGKGTTFTVFLPKINL